MKWFWSVKYVLVFLLFMLQTGPLKQSNYDMRERALWEAATEKKGEYPQGGLFWRGKLVAWSWNWIWFGTSVLKLFWQKMVVNIKQLKLNDGKYIVTLLQNQAFLLLWSCCAPVAEQVCLRRRVISIHSSSQWLHTHTLTRPWPFRRAIVNKNMMEFFLVTICSTFNANTNTEEKKNTWVTGCQHLYMRNLFDSM